MGHHRHRATTQLPHNHHRNNLTSTQPLPPCNSPTATTATVQQPNFHTATTAQQPNFHNRQISYRENPAPSPTNGTGVTEGAKPLIGSAKLPLQEVVDDVGFGSLLDKKLELKRPSGRPHGKLEINGSVQEPRYRVPDPYYAPYSVPTVRPPTVNQIQSSDRGRKLYASNGTTEWNRTIRFKTFTKRNLLHGFAGGGLSNGELKIPLLIYLQKVYLPHIE
ncbi:protein SRC2 [Forsythia ovata]|uniref:Protein SRC2 n=1 Tax=Forsythia ovata TaxID=205694 RepID=A0ABD1X1Y2_9LAMI